MLPAGRLKDRVTIQSRSVTRDAYGAEVITWATLATVWASVESISGREYLATTGGADQLLATRTTRVVIRYRDDVGPTMRVVHETRTLEIDAVLARGNDEWLDLMCSDCNEATA